MGSTANTLISSFIPIRSVVKKFWGSLELRVLIAQMQQICALIRNDQVIPPADCMLLLVNFMVANSNDNYSHLQ